MLSTRPQPGHRLPAAMPEDARGATPGEHHPLLPLLILLLKSSKGKRGGTAIKWRSTVQTGSSGGYKRRGRR